MSSVHGKKIISSRYTVQQREGKSENQDAKLRWKDCSLGVGLLSGREEKAPHHREVCAGLGFWVTHYDVAAKTTKYTRVL